LATVPMLRGVWGAALHHLAPEVYNRVFGPNDPAPGGARGKRDSAAAPRGHATLMPSYILRPAPPDPEFAPAIEWTLLGEAVHDDVTLCRAWDVASGMGLGPDRQPFRVLDTLVLEPDGSAVANAPQWTLDNASLLVWPSNHLGSEDELDSLTEPEAVRNGEAESLPCRLVLRTPLRIMFRGRLVRQPTWTDIVVAACRRVGSFLPSPDQQGWRELQRAAIEQSREARQGKFNGDRLDLHRYSGRQQRDLSLQGVSGTLDLPDGPGPLWPLLAAAQWLHVGKGTVMGLGQVELESG
ncbi:MAG: CRISPR system precrRNA processing endoribonuclease RAMP protein Cas6, partial [Planctomycetota bacterium]